MRAKSFQSCLTLRDPMDCSPPGSSLHGILQARILEWAAMPSSRGSNTAFKKQTRKQRSKKSTKKKKSVWQTSTGSSLLLSRNFWLPAQAKLAIPCSLPDPSTAYQGSAELSRQSPPSALSLIPPLRHPQPCFSQSVVINKAP